MTDQGMNAESTPTGQLARVDRKYMVPENRTNSALEKLANELFKLTTILEVKEVADRAEAYRAWYRTQKAGEALHRDATVILTRAERRLGELTSELRPSREQRNAAEVLQKRRQQLRDAGVAGVRAKRAELLASIPSPAFEKSLQKLQNPTPGKVLADNGLQVYQGSDYTSPDWRKLAIQAIATVDSLRHDLPAIAVNGSIPVTQAVRIVADRFKRLRKIQKTLEE